MATWEGYCSGFFDFKDALLLCNSVILSHSWKTDLRGLTNSWDKKGVGVTRGVESLIGLAQDQAFILNEEESFRELLVACHSELVQPRYP